MIQGSRSTFRSAASRLFLVFLFGSCLGRVHALENGLARTPPMGWNPWNAFRENINEALIKEVADKLVSTGLAKAGYQYLVLDNGWYMTPNASQYNSAKFPGGIKSLADYAHQRGLKFGLYTNWDSRNNEVRDATQWAGWGVDYVKHDAWKLFSTDSLVWLAMRDALLGTKRPVVYSVHFQDRAKVIGNPKIMNMWRFTNDLVPYYNRESLPASLDWGVTTVDILNDMARVAQTTGPGSWADADMLMVEQGNQNLEEWKTAFAISCILPSPMILSADIRKSPQEVLDIYLNEELIAVNQDTSGNKSWKVRDDGAKEVWARKLQDGTFAVVLFNTDPQPGTMQVRWNELKSVATKASVRNLWTKKDVGIFADAFSATVPAHGTAFLKVAPDGLNTRIKGGKPLSRRNALPEFRLHRLSGGLDLSMKQAFPRAVEATCALSNLNGTRVLSRDISFRSGPGASAFIPLPGDWVPGTYVLRVVTGEPGSDIHSDFRKRVYIGRW